MFNQPLNFFSNGNVRTLNSGFPQMAETLTGWEFPLTLQKIKQTIENGLVTKTFETINFLGVVQPLKDEQLQFLDIGEWSREWLWIHAKSSTLNLNTQDKIIFENKRYKVMNKKDYHLNGFIEYFICRDYEDTELINNAS